MRRRRRFYGAPVPRPQGATLAVKHGYAFPSVAELVAAALGKSDMADVTRASRTKPTSGRYGDRENWAGASWEDAVKMAQNGDLDGARRLSPAVLDAVNMMIHNQPRLDPVFRLDEGRWIDIARYVKGEPECWGDMVDATPALRKGAAVIVNVAAQHTILPGQIDAVGVALGSAILGLQAMGYSVTLYAAQKISNYSNECLLISAPVNPGGAPLDVSRMSVVLRPWFLRRVIFSLEETFTGKVREEMGIGNGYGRPADIGAADAESISGLKNAIVINFNTAVTNPDRVKETIVKQIQGGK